MVGRKFIFVLKQKLEPGIYRDKTIADNLMYILNDDTLYNTFNRLNLLVETFENST